MQKIYRNPLSHQRTIFCSLFSSNTISRKKLGQIQEELAASKFWTRFPPKGVGVHSWYVVMGIGMVVTLKVPPEKLREVNRTIEQTAWGTFRTEFFATYDFWPVVQRIKEKAASSSK